MKQSSSTKTGSHSSTYSELVKGALRTDKMNKMKVPNALASPRSTHMAGSTFSHCNAILPLSRTPKSADTLQLLSPTQTPHTLDQLSKTYTGLTTSPS